MSASHPYLSYRNLQTSALGLVVAMVQVSYTMVYYEYTHAAITTNPLGYALWINIVIASCIRDTPWISMV